MIGKTSLIVGREKRRKGFVILNRNLVSQRWNFSTPIEREWFERKRKHLKILLLNFTYGLKKLLNAVKGLSAFQSPSPPNPTAKYRGRTERNRIFTSTSDRTDLTHYLWHPLAYAIPVLFSLSLTVPAIFKVNFLSYLKYFFNSSSQFLLFKVRGGIGTTCGVHIFSYYYHVRPTTTSNRIFFFSVSLSYSFFSFLFLSSCLSSSLPLL